MSFSVFQWLRSTRSWNSFKKVGKERTSNYRWKGVGRKSSPAMPVKTSGAEKRPPGRKADIETYCKCLWAFSSPCKSSVNREITWKKNIKHHMQELLLPSILYPQPHLPVLTEVSERIWDVHTGLGNRTEELWRARALLNWLLSAQGGYLRWMLLKWLWASLWATKTIWALFLPADRTPNQLKAEPSFS